MPILIDDDDDDIIILDGPPKESKKTEIVQKSTSTRPNVQNNAATRPDSLKRAEPSTKNQVSPPEIPVVSTPVVEISKSRPHAQLDRPLVSHPPAVPSTNKPTVAKKSASSAHPQTMRKPPSTKSTGPSGPERVTATRESGIRIIDDPFSVIPEVPSGLIKPALVQKSTSSSGLVSGLVHLSMDDQEMASPNLSNMGGDDPLEYMTPPPLPLPPPGSDHHGVGGAKTLSTAPEADILIQTQSVSKVQEARLLPSWINVRHSAPDAEPDLWQRARTQTQLAARSNSSTAGVGPGANARRKMKAKPLNGAKVEKSFFFSADAWMNQTRLGLGF